MAICPKCGIEVADDAKFCPACGAPMKAEEASDKKEEFKEKASAFAADVKGKFEEAKAAAEADDAETYDEEDINKNKIFAVIAYLGILFIVPLLAAKESKFARFHANQGLILFACYVIAYVLTFIPVVKYFAWVVDLALFILMIMGILAASKGEAKELPVIGKYRFIK